MGLTVSTDGKQTLLRVLDLKVGRTYKSIRGTLLMVRRGQKLLNGNIISKWWNENIKIGS